MINKPLIRPYKFLGGVWGWHWAPGKLSFQGAMNQAQPGFIRRHHGNSFGHPKELDQHNEFSIILYFQIETE